MRIIGHVLGAAGLVPYSATKFGVRAMTEGLDGEWAADGIRVRSLMPGFIDTPLIRGTVTGTRRCPMRSSRHLTPDYRLRSGCPGLFEQSQ